MPTMTDSQSIAANTTIPNVLSGKAFEFVASRSLVRVYVVSSAAGINATFLVGGVSQIQDQLCSGANRFPIIPDDLVVECVALPGSRLVLSLRNTTAGALTAISRVEVIAF